MATLGSDTVQGANLVWTADDNNEDNETSPLGDSELTQPTDGSISEDEGGGWLGSIGTDFRQIATCFKNSTLPVLGGVAALFHETVTTVAAEIALLEREGDIEGSVYPQITDRKVAPSALPLPWEIQQDVTEPPSQEYIADKELMHDIFELSRHENTFAEPCTESESPTTESEQSPFLDNSRIALIRRLLDLDENLASMYARSSGRSDNQEIVFWRNYFQHCEEKRKRFLEQRLLPHQKEVVCSGPHSEGILSEARTGSTTDEDLSISLMDDSSLISSSTAGDSSYVIPSAPNSLNTLTTMRSVEDLVLVGEKVDDERHSNP